MSAPSISTNGPQPPSIRYLIYEDRVLGELLRQRNLRGLETSLAVRAALFSGLDPSYRQEESEHLASDDAKYRKNLYPWQPAQEAATADGQSQIVVDFLEAVRRGDIHDPEVEAHLKELERGGPIKPV